jgi:hypothetical protein
MPIPLVVRGALAVKARRPTEDNAADAELASYSVYFGRERLGHFVRMDKRAFDSFDSTGRALGTFRTQRDAIAAIEAALAGRP